MVTFSEYCEKQNKLYKALDALIELESTKYCKAINSLMTRKPFIATADGDIDCSKIPNFGDYRPAGWELVDELFVDNSGFGGSDEPALTVKQFKSLVEKGFGYAIIDEGQFQIWIGKFNLILAKSK